MPTITRTWRRDQSRNEMPIEEAVDNLMSRGLPEVTRLGTVGIRDRLLAGHELYTPLASFRIEQEGVEAA
jgi:hypothetical protein